MNLESSLQDGMRSLISEKRHLLALYIEKMKGLSPLEKLNSGFSYVENEAGKNIRSLEQLQIGENVLIRMRDGTVSAEVKRLEWAE